MSFSSQRLQTMKALLAGSVACSSSSRFHDIINELDELVAAKRVSDQKRRLLLEVLHSTRALDSSLAAVNAHYSCDPNAKTLGQYLHALVNHSHASLGRLSTNQVGQFKVKVVNLRNRYMHSAGAFPQKSEVIHILAAIEQCLATVVALE